MNSANGPIIFTYYAQSELSRSSLQFIKRPAKKNFLYIDVNNNDSHHRKTTCKFIYTKKLKNETFIYTKSQTLRNKQDNFSLKIYTQKAWHFVLRNFSWNFWNWQRGGGIFICKKQFTLRYIFICKKNCTLHYISICKK